MSAMNAICEGTARNSQTEPTDASFEGKILAHHAKAGYDYPTIRLPFTFSGLIGRSTRIYQTVHNGALVFLVVVSPERSQKKREKSFSSVPRVFTRRRSPIRIRPSPSVFDKSVERIYKVFKKKAARPYVAGGLSVRDFSEGKYAEKDVAAQVSQFLEPVNEFLRYST